MLTCFTPNSISGIMVELHNDEENLCLCGSRRLEIYLSSRQRSLSEIKMYMSHYHFSMIYTFVVEYKIILSYIYFENSKIYDNGACIL